ncbi:ABC transporter ATP-binding protein [Desulfobulbus alkaliphilus]|uniref:ABC transporter ATP-binding protein n=1 Tax=Desulfobulbus alkaliphilus TaxID=869814 RepID=UPI00196494A5|nr:ABC transporter ATP-binding protein [Desulfobulbus alkaliphilus]MBM9538659.1 ABC transporter ATP-binding protein [Desulfobulbus alkaliphilus]
MNTATVQPILSARDLSVGYNKTPVLSGLDFDCEAGQFISLLGPNGAGKTTLLRTLSRHLAPLAGAITLHNKSLDTLPAMDLARTMAVVLTDKIVPPLFTVFEFVTLGRYPHTDYLGRLNSEDQKIVTQSLAAVHALDLAGRPFSDLSDGERQKVLVARALAQEPFLLLLDEPTIHLDLKHRVEVMAILRDLCRDKGITVIASLHDVDVAAKVSDQVALIKDGGLLDWGAPEAVLTPEAVSGLYDFSKAEFNRHLGGIELRGEGNRGRAFVVAGMGTGSLVYRMLAKKGFAIATGVVHTNDLDYYVAQSLGADCITTPPLEAINGTSTNLAATLMDSCDFVIDSGFAVSTGNQANMTLLHTALERGKTVFTLRGDVLESPAANSDNRFIRCTTTTQLIAALDAFPKRNAAHQVQEA